MKLYMLTWAYGEYDDAADVEFGAYTTPEKRQKVIDKLKAGEFTGDYKFVEGIDHGKFVCWEMETDAFPDDRILQHYANSRKDKDA